MAFWAPFCGTMNRGKNKMSDEIIIGLDTSNYRTSVAAVTTDGCVLMDWRELLPVPAGEKGLRQNDAVFAHTRQIRKCEDQLRSVCASGTVAAVAASISPRDGDASYMPAFQVGQSLGMMMAAAMGVPFYATTHQRGHLAAAAQGTELEYSKSYLAVHLSGGTTDLLEVSEDKVIHLGGSLDLHAGQLVDRIGVALGLPFPSGEALEKLAEYGETHGLLGASMEQTDLCCHFSGAETKAQIWIREGSMSPENVAREIYDLFSRTFLRLLTAGMKKTGIHDALLTGGVASSSLLRQMMMERSRRIPECPNLVFGNSERCGDNAVGVALIGANRWKSDRL